jgi:DNA-directed RNA polymerase alpha subunit
MTMIGTWYNVTHQAVFDALKRNRGEKVLPRVATKELEVQPTLPDVSIDRLGLAIRPYNCLRRAGIADIPSLLVQPAGKVRAIRNLSPKSFDEIIDRLIEFCIQHADDLEAVRTSHARVEDWNNVRQ